MTNDRLAEVVARCKTRVVTRAVKARGWALLLPLCAALAVTLLGACSSASGPDLVGHSFVATEVTGHRLVKGTEIRLTFNDGQIGAGAGCNGMGGPATWDDGVLVVGQLTSTLIGCPDALARQDQWLGEFLTSRPSLSLDGSTLTLSGTTVRMTLTRE